MDDAEYRAQQRRGKADLFQELDDMEAEQRAAGTDPSQNRPEFPEQVKVTAEIPRDLHLQLQQIAFQNGLSMTRLAAMGLELVLQRAHDGTLPRLPDWPGTPA